MTLHELACLGQVELPVATPDGDEKEQRHIDDPATRDLHRYSQKCAGRDTAGDREGRAYHDRRPQRREDGLGQRMSQWHARAAARRGVEDETRRARNRDADIPMQFADAKQVARIALAGELSP